MKSSERRQLGLSGSYISATKMKRIVALAVFLTVTFLSASSVSALDYTRSIESVAGDIADLQGSYPQLKDFSVARNLKADEHRISYGYQTYRTERPGGWTSGVPTPHEDGIWFYIDFHSPASTAQIHTQPVAIPYCIGDMRVSFLILEGPKTKSVDGAIRGILQKHGATKCQG